MIRNLMFMALMLLAVIAWPTMIACERMGESVAPEVKLLAGAVEEVRALRPVDCDTIFGGCLLPETKVNLLYRDGTSHTLSTASFQAYITASTFDHEWTETDAQNALIAALIRQNAELERRVAELEKRQ